ncbi:hypothetical protein GCM10011402_37920 [Paracoccus acridae]|uniref:Uncharacterized protein n=1 Tax=Paracoccus acridae TaxID=1795310 RepID=A0ABQ1VMW7_9RHOB|nr:hypothetical protein GCM10011402_37920 [Paracoccus acridae]
MACLDRIFGRIIGGLPKGKAGKGKAKGEDNCFDGGHGLAPCKDWL